MGRKSKQGIYLYNEIKARGIMPVLLLGFFLLFSFCATAQSDSIKYWVQFTDKANNQYSIDDPEEFLSARALQRRANQNIPIKKNDLPVSPSYLNQLRNLGADILHTSRWLNAATICTNDTNLINQIQQLPFVKNTDLVKTLRLKEPLEEKFPHASFKQMLDYGAAQNQVEMLNGDILHQMGYRGEGMWIAVIDAGFNNAQDHWALQRAWEEGRILGTYDFYDMEEDVFDDGSSHGTHVLMTMAANVPEIYIGTAPEASYWLLRSEVVQFELLVEEDNWVAAAEFSDSIGVDVINTSLGYSTFNDTSMNHSYEDMDGDTTRITKAADIAASKGMIIVNSAGNEGHLDWKYVTAPADGDSVLTVGAVGPEGNYAIFSSQGPTHDGRIKPNVMAQGAKVAIPGNEYGSYRETNGTSFSSPIIAGMAACLWQANRNKTNMEIFHAIEKSASQYENPDFLMGYGIPNFANANYLLTGLEFSNFDHTFQPLVYPNPFRESFSLFMYGDVDLYTFYEIYDINGDLKYADELFIRAENFNNITIKALSEHPSGVYFVHVRTEFENVVLKIVKQ